MEGDFCTPSYIPGTQLIFTCTYTKDFLAHADLTWSSCALTLVARALSKTAAKCGTVKSSASAQIPQSSWLAVKMT